VEGLPSLALEECQNMGHAVMDAGMFSLVMILNPSLIEKIQNK
jgi:hypothetical protein